MKICIPIESDQGMTSKVCDHFGSAPFFLLFDDESGNVDIINNSDHQHAHGMCHPLKVLEDHPINAVVCRGMGARAVQKLNEDGIKAFRMNAATAQEIIDDYRQGTLEELTAANACTDHGCR